MTSKSSWGTPPACPVKPASAAETDTEENKQPTKENAGGICRSEGSDDYFDVVVRLNNRWRVIVCKDSIQWILQRRDTGTAQRPWRGKRYCTTKSALLRGCGEKCGDIDPAAMAVLEALPAKFRLFRPS